MIVICDAPGQTCNRLWSYLASISECIIKHKKMVILFYDWEIENFPNLLHCRWIFFPLWHKWYLEHGNGWNNYKGLTWKATHSNRMDKIYKFLGFVKGWHTRRNTEYIFQAKKELQHIYRPQKEITDKSESFIRAIKQQADIVVGVHIRRGDYATWNNGRFFYSLEDYHQFMLRVKKLYSNKKVSFFISSDENFSLEIFNGCKCFRFMNEESGVILDLHTLSICDRIIGPFSTFSRWASFIGEVPLCFIETKDQVFNEKGFSIIRDFFHFENGKEILDW